MTTIIWDGDEIASDSRSCSGGLIDSGVCRKLFLNKRVLYAIAGDYAQAMSVMRWMSEGRDPDVEPVFIEPEYEVLMIREGTGYFFSGETHGYEVMPPFALGTGREVGLGALATGASVKKAVEAACKLDPNSAPPVKVMKT
jgi:hypothetical protein